MALETPLGFPYPEGTDPTANGAVAIQALADYIDEAVGVHASGTGTVDIVSAGVQAVLAVVFPAGRFTSAPHVTVTPDVTTVTNVRVAVDDVTTAGCNIRAVREGSTSDIPVNWHAHQPG